MWSFALSTLALCTLFTKVKSFFFQFIDWFFTLDYPDAIAPVNWSYKKDPAAQFIEYDSRAKEKENPIRKWSFGKMAISAIQFSPDGGRLAIASRNGKCYVVKVGEICISILWTFRLRFLKMLTFPSRTSALFPLSLEDFCAARGRPVADF